MFFFRYTLGSNALVGLLALFSGATAQSFAEKPVAHVKPDFAFKRYVGVADVGSLKADSSEQVEFEIKNGTSIELDLREVQVSCTCTRVRIPKVKLQPGKSVSAMIEMQTPKYAAAKKTVFFNIPLPAPSKDKVSIRLEYSLTDMMSFKPEGLKTTTDEESGTGIIDFDVVIAAPAKHDDVQIKLVPEIDDAIIERKIEKNAIQHRITLPKASVGKGVSGAIVLIDRRTNKQRQSLPFMIANSKSVSIKPNPCWARKQGDKYAASCMLQIKDKPYLAAQIESNASVKSLSEKCSVTFKPLKKGVARLTLEFDELPANRVPIVFTHGRFQFIESVSFASLEKKENN